MQKRIMLFCFVLLMLGCNQHPSKVVDESSVSSQAPSVFDHLDTSAFYPAPTMPLREPPPLIQKALSEMSVLIDIVRLDENSFNIILKNQSDSELVLHKELITGFDYEIRDRFGKPIETETVDEENTLPFDAGNFTLLAAGESITAKFCPVEHFYRGTYCIAVPLIGSDGRPYLNTLPYGYSDRPVRLRELPKDEFSISVAINYDPATEFFLKHYGFDVKFFPEKTNYLFRVTEDGVQRVSPHHPKSPAEEMSL